MGLGGAIGPWLGGYLFDLSGSYDHALILCMACLILSAVFFWIAAPRHAEKIRAGRLGSHVG
jgi:cyanate permease